MYLRPTYYYLKWVRYRFQLSRVPSKDKDRKKGPYLSDIFPDSGGTSTGSYYKCCGSESASFWEAGSVSGSASSENVEALEGHFGEKWVIGSGSSASNWKAGYRSGDADTQHWLLIAKTTGLPSYVKLQEIQTGKTWDRVDVILQQNI